MRLNFKMNSNHIKVMFLRFLAVVVCMCLLSCGDRDFDNTLTVTEELVD